MNREFLGARGSLQSIGRHATWAEGAAGIVGCVGNGTVGTLGNCGSGGGSGGVRQLQMLFAENMTKRWARTAVGRVEQPGTLALL